MLILDKLWNGELNPGGRKIQSAGFSASRQEFSQAEGRLLEVLGPEGRERLEAYENAWVSQSAALEQDAFFLGFRTAGLLLLDILWGTETQ